MTDSSEANESDSVTPDESDSETPDESAQPKAAVEDDSASNTATAEAPAGAAPAEGWYPDPNAGGANVMRYWDGGAWTENVKEGQTEVNTSRRTAVERKAILAQQLQGAAARGLRIESQSDFQAILVKGQPVNNTLHAILTVFTCLLWGIVWAVIAATGGEKREMIVVDEFGNVQHQRLGRS